MARARRRGRAAPRRLPNARALEEMPVEKLCGLLYRTTGSPEQALEGAILTRGAAAIAPLMAAHLGGYDVERPERIPGAAAAGALLASLGPGDCAAQLVATWRAGRRYPSARYGSLFAATEAALRACGPAAVAPILSAIGARGPADVEVGGLTAILSGLGVRDPRILSSLLAQLALEPAEAAANLAVYGDPAALPALREALARAPIRRPEPGALPSNRGYAACREAIGALGGELSPDEASRDAIFLSLQPDRGGSPEALLEAVAEVAASWGIERREP